MAKAVFFDFVVDDSGNRHFTGMFNNTAPFQFEVVSETELLFTAQNENTMVLNGTGFVEDSDGISGGTIVSATFFNADGDIVATVTDFSVSASAYFDQLSETDNTSIFRDLMLAGKDRFTSSDLGDTFLAGKGNDVLIGGAATDFLTGGKGRDTITGGADDDLFGFAKGDGKDVVTDFDAKGKFGDQQDLIETSHAMFNHAKIVKSGNNTLIDFAGKDEILLLHIKPGQIDQTDFFFF